MNLQRDSFNFQKLAKSMTSSSYSYSSGGSGGGTYSHKVRGRGYRSSTTAVDDTMIGTSVRGGLTTKLPNSANVYGRSNSPAGTKIPINSTMMKQRAGDVSVKSSPTTSMSASNHISTRSTQPALYKQAAVGALIGGGIRGALKVLSKPIVKFLGKKNLYSTVRSTASKGLYPGVNPTRLGRLERLRKGGRLSSDMLKGFGPGTTAETIGTMSKRVGIASKPLMYEAAKKTLKGKALKWGTLGGLGYGSYRGAKFVSDSRDPRSPHFNYDRHVRENIVSGRINPAEVHPSTIRSIMMKRGSMDKEAIIGSVVKKIMPTTIFSALSIPGVSDEYKKKVLLDQTKKIVRPNIKGNVARF